MGLRRPGAGERAKIRFANEKDNAYFRRLNHQEDGRQDSRQRPVLRTLHPLRAAGEGHRRRSGAHQSRFQELRRHAHHPVRAQRLDPFHGRADETAQLPLRVYKRPAFVLRRDPLHRRHPQGPGPDLVHQGPDRHRRRGHRRYGQNHHRPACPAAGRRRRRREDLHDAAQTGSLQERPQAGLCGHGDRKPLHRGFRPRLRPTGPQLQRHLYPRQ